MLYENYHKHTHESNIMTPDSPVTQEEYAIRAIELGHKTISTVEHGWQGKYYDTYDIAKKYNLKFIFGTEAYWVKDNLENDRTNSHIIILAKNETGRRAINCILSDANIDGYYYKPRVDLKSLMALPRNDVVITTACLAFWHYEDIDDIVIQLHNHFKDNFYLEVQYHHTDIQRNINRRIIKLSQTHNIKLIMGCDSHFIYPEQSKERDNILEAKGIRYENEDGWFMDYCDGDTAIDRFNKQGVLNTEQINEAMQNTNVVLTFDNIEFSKEIKLPTLYPNLTQKEKDNLYKKIILDNWKEYSKDIPKSEHKHYMEEIKNEVRTIVNTKMADYFLIDYEIVKEAIKNGGLITFTGRGCFTSSALVHTKHTLKSINNVTIGDEIISSNGTFNKVKNIMAYDIDEELIQIKHLYGTDKYYPTTCTLNHNILINRNNSIIWCEAQYVTNNDYVCVPKIKTSDYINDIIDLNDYNIYNFDYDEKYIYEYCSHKNNAYTFSPKSIAIELNVPKSSMENFANGNKNVFKNNIQNKINFFNNYPFETQTDYVNYIHDMRTTKINRFIKIDEIFNIFIGLMYGDGCNTCTKSNDISLAIHSINNIDNKIIFNIIAERLGLKVLNSISKTKNLTQLHIYSKIFREFISNNLFISKLNQFKNFNPLWFNQHQSCLKGIIKGLRMSDGHYEGNRINFDNTSLSIINAYKILCLMTDEGINSLSIRPSHITNNYNCKESYKLRINVNALNSNKLSNRLQMNNNYWFLPVTDIVKLPKQKVTVYDLEIDKCSDYLINNMIVHNSSVSYFTNTLLGFSKVDRISSPVHLYPERFISETRILQTKSLPDLDLNCGNPEVFVEAQEKILGKGHSYPMISFGTFQIKSAFKLYAKSQNIPFVISNEITKQIEKYEKALKYAEEEEKDLVDVFEYVDEEYHDILNNSKRYTSIISEKKIHPCAYLIYDGDIRSEIGLIRIKNENSGKNVITTVIDGNVAEKYKFLKNDLLKVDVVLIIHSIYKKIGIIPHTVNELLKITKNNDKVWDIYKNGMTMTINQVEKQSTTKKVQKYKPINISELTAFIAAIRPSFKSMYSVFEMRQPFEYGINTFDKLIQTTEMPNSFVLYQEQMMATLKYAGFPADETYSIIKAISKKKPKVVSPLKTRFIKGFSQQLLAEDNITDTEASTVSTMVWNIIEDSAGYGFNAAHAYSYALDSLYGAYLKSYYPLEFYETILEIYTDKNKKDKVAKLKQELDNFNITIGELQFGLNNTGFIADKNNRIISDNMLAIKYISKVSSIELYELGKGFYCNFIDILIDLNEFTSVNKRQLKILTILHYFSEFGRNKKLLDFTILFNEFYTAKSIKKIKYINVAEDNQKDTEIINIVSGCVLYNLIEKHSTSTNKTFKNIDTTKLLMDLWDLLEDKLLKFSIQVEYEIEYLGYIKSVLPTVPSTYFIVADIKVYKNSSKPHFILYNIKTGTYSKMKVTNENYFIKRPFLMFSMIETLNTSHVAKNVLIKGEWKKSKTEFEDILNDWNVL